MNGAEQPVTSGLNACAAGGTSVAVPPYTPFAPTNTAPFAATILNPAAAGAWYPGKVWVALLQGNDAFQIPAGPPATLGLIFGNNQTATLGNDIAFDKPMIFDATPRLDKDFEPMLISPGGTSSLVFTVTNTTDLLDKDHWAFEDHLPEGVIVTVPEEGGPPHWTTTCADSAVGVLTDDIPLSDVRWDDLAPLEGGETSFVVAGALRAGEASCTVTVDVTVTGEYLIANEIEVTDTAEYFSNTIDTDFEAWGLVGTPTALLKVKLPVAKIDVAPPTVADGPSGSTELTWIVSVVNASSYDQTTGQWAVYCPEVEVAESHELGAWVLPGADADPCDDPDPVHHGVSAAQVIPVSQSPTLAVTTTCSSRCASTSLFCALSCWRRSRSSPRMPSMARLRVSGAET